MALFIRQNDNRSQLQERLAAELQERAKKNAQKDDLPDGVADSQFIKGTKQTTSLAWVWAIVVILLVAAVIWLTISSAKG
jgi:hypothetical protein